MRSEEPSARFAATVLAACAAVGALAASSISAWGASPDDIVWGTELAMRPARPYIIVAPRYPKEAAEQKREATVDVVGRVNAVGTMEDASYRSSSEDPAFQREVSEVVRLWTFKAPIDSDTCTPKGGDAQLRVWFELGEKGPKVSISTAQEDMRPRDPTHLGLGPAKIVGKVIPVFPRAAIRKGIQGARVLAIARVTPSGDVASVTFQNTGADALFLEEVERALKRWKFDLGATDLKGRPHLCAEIPVDFALTP